AGEVSRRRQADRRGHLRPVAIGSVTALRRCPDERGVARALLGVWSSSVPAVLVASWRPRRQLASSSSAGVLVVSWRPRRQPALAAHTCRHHRPRDGTVSCAFSPLGLGSTHSWTSPGQRATESAG